MPYNISIKFHPIPSTLNFSRFFCGNGGHSEISKPQNYVYTCQTKFLENFIQFRAPFGGHNKSDCHIWAFFNFLIVYCKLHLCIHVLNFSNKVGIKIFVFFTCYSQPILAKIKLCTLRRLDRIVPVHFFRTWLSRVLHHKLCF